MDTEPSGSEPREPDDPIPGFSQLHEQYVTPNIQFWMYTDEMLQQMISALPAEYDVLLTREPPPAEPGDGVQTAEAGKKPDGKPPAPKKRRTGEQPPADDHPGRPFWPRLSKKEMPKDLTLAGKRCGEALNLGIDNSYQLACVRIYLKKNEMSLIPAASLRITNPVNLSVPLTKVRDIHSTSRYCQESSQPEEVEKDSETKETDDGKRKKRPVVDLETSIKYMTSKAYKIAYRDSKVWEPYRRNFKGHFQPRKTRRTCIRGGVISTGNPCPICRDEYLVVHPKNLDLLKQFISPQTGKLISYSITGVCQTQQTNMMIAITQAWDEGLLEMPLPYRRYDYKEYYSKEILEQNQFSSQES